MQSRVGDGSTFSFSIVLKHASGAGAGAAGTLPAVTTVRDEVLAGFTILVVDDNQLNRDLLSEALRRMGADVLTADCGRAAIQTLKDRASSIDAVLMDVQMPDITGDEVTRIVRAEIPAAAAIPIIAVTANAFSEQRQAYLLAGMNAVVLKPVDFPSLAATLIGLLDSKHKHARVEYHSAAADQEHIAPLNREHIDGLLRFVSEERVRELLNSTLDQVEKHLTELAEAKESQSPRLAEMAHDIKGLSANMGLDQISHAAAELEKGHARGDAQILIEALSLVTQLARKELKGTPSLGKAMA